jgi:hypothetical protein
MILSKFLNVVEYDGVKFYMILQKGEPILEFRQD